jgi:arsenate reductase
MQQAAQKKKVLIVCTGNACRSQMAEALWRYEAGDHWEAASAGTSPAGFHPLAKACVEELGIDTSGQYSKSVFSMEPARFDLVITVCDSAREACPYLGNHPWHEHWPFPDPITATGEPDERLAEFRRVRDAIHQRIRDFLAFQDEAEVDGAS